MFFDFILLVLFMLFENILILFIDWDLFFDVFVINFVLNVLFDFNKCKMIFVYKGCEFKGDVDCSRILIGD